MKDITGQRFGKLVAIAERGRAKDRQVLWLCLCDCGREKIAKGRDLRCGDVKSCGCLHKHYGSHYSREALYGVWSRMKKCCNNTNSQDFRLYGQRGIDICEEWEADYKSFRCWSLENGYAPGLSIDRIDNDRGYNPENCRWTDATTQANNTRRNHKITIGDDTLTCAQWERKMGLYKGAIYTRTNRGWTEEMAITTPVTRRADHDEHA